MNKRELEKVWKIGRRLRRLWKSDPWSTSAMDDEGTIQWGRGARRERARRKESTIRVEMGVMHSFVERRSGSRIERVKILVEAV